MELDEHSLKRGDILLYNYDISTNYINTVLCIVLDVSYESFGAIDICYVNEVYNKNDYQLQTTPFIVKYHNNDNYKILEILDNIEPKLSKNINNIKNSLSLVNRDYIEKQIKTKYPEMFV